MATLKILGSGSTGNCYIITCNKERLILDVGIKWSEIVKGLEYSIDDISGVLVSHRHGDHSASLSKVLAFRLPAYSCKDVVDRYEGTTLLLPNKKYRIGGFIVQPIPVQHNVENYAYLIEHEDFGRLVFATDLCEFPYKIKNVNHWLIEANYDENIVLERLGNMEIIRSQNQNHLSIDQCIQVLKNNYTISTYSVVLIHLSSENSNEENFIKRVWNEVGILPTIANKGVSLTLRNEDF